MAEFLIEAIISKNGGAMKKSILYIFFVLNIITANAAIILEEESEGKISKIVIENNCIKIENKSDITILDFNNSRIFVGVKETGKYWDGNIDEFEKEIDEIFFSAVAEREKSIEWKYSGFYEYVAFENYYNSKLKKEEELIDDIRVKIAATGLEEKIAGKISKQYLVFVDGNKVREYWITAVDELKKELDIEKMKEFMWRYYLISEGIEPIDVSEKVMNLNKLGLELKTIKYKENKIVSTETVKRIKIEKLDKKEFEIPRNFKKVKLSELNLK